MTHIRQSGHTYDSQGKDKTVRAYIRQSEQSEKWNADDELPLSSVYRGTSLSRNRPTLGPYSRPMPRALWLS